VAKRSNNRNIEEEEQQVCQRGVTECALKKNNDKHIEER
jgi:hypothetical protein